MRERGNSAAWLMLVVLFCVWTGWEVTALAWVRGTAHDFRSPEYGGPNTNYPKLAQTVEGDACRGCHRLTSARSSDYPWLAPDGWEPQVKVNLPGAGRCLGCHEGEIPTAYGLEEMRNPARIIAGKKHRRHRSEFPFPPASPEIKEALRLTPTIITENGKVLLLGKNGVKLPLYVNRQTGELKASCLTCHNHHLPGESGYFLRTGTVQELCHTCHEPRQP